MDTSQNTSGTGPETWVREAIAEQEEYIKRISSCVGQLGRSHEWGTVWNDEPERAAARWQECVTCGVTKTREDYARRGGSETGSSGAPAADPSA